MLSAGMFNNLGQFTTGPSVEELEARRDRALRDVRVKHTKYNTRIFDMHDANDVKEYQATMLKLLELVRLGSAVIWNNDKDILSRNNVQGWYRHLEWSEYEIEERPVVAVGG